MKGKGIIAEGYDADLVLMDYENLKDNATYEAPTELAGGLDAVFVNGVLSYCNGALTGKHAGKLIRYGGCLRGIPCGGTAGLHGA